MKKYLLIREILPIQIPQIEYTEEGLREKLEELKFNLSQMSFIDKPKHNSTSYLQQEISEETFTVLDSICNVEIDNFGNKEYICNKIRMRIEEIKE